MPQIHFAPASGWMNDPNGLVHLDGRHHLFFQHNPLGPTFGRMTWGHASSTDLLTWDVHPDALLPGDGGTGYDDDGCWSGCTVVEDGGGVAVLYTGVSDGGRRQRPCLARATGPDLLAFRKHPGNPVLPEPPLPGVTDFRDHTVVRDGGVWRHLVAGAVPGVGGAVFGYVGESLEAWRYEGLALDASRVDLPDRVWECPDLFLDRGVAVLVVSVVDDDGQVPGPPVRWVLGTFDGGRLEPAATGVVDHGRPFYAPQSYTAQDGRRLMVGWVRTHLDPAVAGSPSRGVMSLPRELTVRDGRLHQEPARELDALRGTPAVVDGAIPASGRVRLGSPLPVLEVELGGAAVSGLVLRSSAAGVEHVVELPPARPGGDGRVRVLADEGVVEAFRDGGAATGTDLRLSSVDEVRVDAPGGRVLVRRLAREGVLD